MIRLGMEVERVDDPAARLARFSVARVIEAVRIPMPTACKSAKLRRWTGSRRSSAALPTPDPACARCTRRPALSSRVRRSPWSRARCGAWSRTACSARRPSWNWRRVRRHSGTGWRTRWNAGGRGARARSGHRLRGDTQSARLAGCRGYRAGPRGRRSRGAEVEPSRARSRESFACPIEIRLSAPQACPAFAGRLIGGVRNGRSPEWLHATAGQCRAAADQCPGDITNYYDLDRARTAACL